MNLIVVSLILGIALAAVSFFLFYSYRRTGGVVLASLAAILMLFGAGSGINQIRNNSVSGDINNNFTTPKVVDDSVDSELDKLTGPFEKLAIDKPSDVILAQYAQAILQFAAKSPTPTISGQIGAADLEWAIKNAPRKISKDYTIRINGIPTVISPRVTISILAEDKVLSSLCLYKSGAATPGSCVSSQEGVEEENVKLDDESPLANNPVSNSVSDNGAGSNMTDGN
jgi:hypothetical protein